VDLDQILYGGDEIEGDLDSIFSKTAASAIPKWWTFKFVMWVKKTLITFEQIGEF
jgi:hypothetical protein